MFEYSPKTWFAVIFDFHKTHVIKILTPSIILIGLYSFFVVYSFEHYFHFAKGTTVVHSLLGFILGLLLVFRTNTAYDKWWEGRKHWGALINNSRNFAIKTSVLFQDLEVKQNFSKLISDFCFTLKGHLENNFDINELSYFKEDDFNNNVHKPSVIAKEMLSLVSNLHKEGKINTYQFVDLNKNIETFIDITGACERIKKTPIPYSYNLHLKKYIFAYSITLPWGLMPDLKYWSVPAVMLIFYAMVGIEIIGEEIEDPFSGDPDDLPLQTFCENIKKNVHSILEI